MPGPALEGPAISEEIRWRGGQPPLTPRALRASSFPTKATKATEATKAPAPALLIRRTRTPFSASFFSLGSIFSGGRIIGARSPWGEVGPLAPRGSEPTVPFAGRTPSGDQLLHFVVENWRAQATISHSLTNTPERQDLDERQADPSQPAKRLKEHRAPDTKGESRR